MLIMTTSSDDIVEPVRIPGATILRSRSACPGCLKLAGDYEGSVKPAIFFVFLAFFIVVFQRVRWQFGIMQGIIHFLPINLFLDITENL
jgi:hypothetical protein